MKRISYLVVVLVAALLLNGVLVKPSAAATCRQLTFYQSNSYKTCVTYIQRMLNDLRSGSAYMPALAVDGYLGPKTKANVMTFQRTEHIQVDGIVGPQTWGHLCHPIRFYVPNFTYGDYYSATLNAGC